METYLVGGAVRDALLGLAIKDRDYVVVGQSPDAMIAAGYKQVGDDFPVFIHPDTGDEYALARTERKTASGYRGFTVHADPDVTLEEDLQRRDLTINAIAQTPDGDLIDPFGGHSDLEKRLLRHVSPAFVEDPVRVLRVARFLARYRPLGFSVADETVALMRQMVESGELNALVPERVWQELVRALAEPCPQAFVEVLRDAGALRVILPEVDALFGVPQTAEYHPEVDTGVHTLMVLEQAARLAPGNAAVGFAALTHDLGKALTPADELPAHKRHETTGLAPLEALCERLKVPNRHRETAKAVCEHHLRMHRLFEMRPGKVLRLIESIGALRSSQRLEDFCAACEADARGRLGFEDRSYPQVAYLKAAREVAVAVSAQPFVERGLTGQAIGDAMRQARIAAIRKIERPVDTQAET